MTTENAKLNALRKALEANASMMTTTRSWGNIMMNENERAKETKAAAAAEAKRRVLAAAQAKATRNKAARNKAEKIAKEQAKQAQIIANHKAKFMTPSGLKKIAKECRWHCQGKSCFAHKAGVCPFIHKGGPGSSKNTAITLKNTSQKKSFGPQTRKSRRS